MWRHRSGRRRRQQFNVRGRRRRERVLRGAWIVAGVALVAAVLGAVGFAQALRAQTRLIGVRASLQAAVDDPAALSTPEGRRAALAQVDGAVASIGVARSRIAGSPVLALAGAVPGLRSQRAGFIQLIDDSAVAARAGRDLLATVDRLADRTQIRDGVLPLDGMRELQQHVRAAGDTIGERARFEGGLWGPLGDARRQFDEVALSNSRRLVEGAEALGAARTFLGSNGRRQYLIAAQNNAEMRDQGAILSYVAISVTEGRMSIDRQGSVQELTLKGPTATPVPPGTQEVFGSIRPTQMWQSVNATADFAFSGRVMADMYRQATGQAIDGVIALDVPALARVLAIVGPVSIEGVAEPFTASNVGRLLLHDFYQGLGPASDNILRRERLGEVVEAVVDRITTGSRDAVVLGRALGDAAGGGHLRLWSADATEEAVFERTGLGGGPATKDPDRTFHVAVENRTASKMDFFLKPSVRQDVRLTKDGAAVVRTTVVMDNQAPRDAPPSYQFGPAEIVDKPGDYLAWVLLWGPAGSRQLQSGVPESGLNLSQFVLVVPAGERRDVTFETVIPDAVRDGRLEVRLVPQARLEPVPLEIRLEAPGWHVDGAGSWQGPWDRVRTFNWDVRRG